MIIVRERKYALLVVPMLPMLFAGLNRVNAQTPLGTRITYQGDLTDGGGPVNGPLPARYRIGGQAGRQASVGGREFGWKLGRCFW